PLALALQAIVRGNARIAAIPERFRVVDDVARVLVADEKAAAEQMNDRETFGRDALGRVIDVEQQIDVPTLAELDVFLGPELADVGRGRWARRLSAGRDGRERRRCRERARYFDEFTTSHLGHNCLPP